LLASAASGASPLAWARTSVKLAVVLDPDTVSVIPPSNP
jgi:hypothetical protein